jgi:predicted ATPase/DNA-binding XRE family transcriptional regulator
LVNDTVPFGLWLKDSRRSMGWTRRELAQLVGCSAETIRKIEAGERRPSRQIAELLAHSLDVAPPERAGFVEFARGSARHAAPALPTQAGERPSSQGAALNPQRPNNLRMPLTPLIGRDELLAEARDRLLRDSTRLLTFVGPPGVGKTRLSLQAASDLLAGFTDGVFFVPLAAATDAPAVLESVARTIGLEDYESAPLLSRLVEHLQGKNMLLLLDNFEQVMPAASLVVDLLQSCPHLKVTVTSRAALRVRGEQQLPVPPLALPALSPLPAVQALLDYPAVAFFVDRARAVKPDFGLSDENAAAVAALCVHLDGVPLAIELVAARVRMLPPEELLGRLLAMRNSEFGIRNGESRATESNIPHSEFRTPHSFDVLADGARDLPARHRSLRNAIDWSYDLLDESERTLFARLGAFAGGFTLTAVEAVCNATGDLPLETLGAVGSLLDKSLVRQEQKPVAGGEVRFSMLETVREYAAGRLATGGEEETIRRWHAEYYLALAETADPQLSGAEQELWFERLEADHDNLRSALSWVLDRGDDEMAARLCMALWHFWDVHTHLTEGRRWFGRVLERSGALPAHLRAGIFNGAGSLASAQGDFENASRLLEQSLALQRELDDLRGVGRSLNNLGLVAMDLGDFERAVPYFEESLQIRREIGDVTGCAGALSNLGLVELYRENPARAVQLFEESLELRRQLGDRRGASIALSNLGEAARQQRDFERARSLFAEALELLREVGDNHVIVAGLGGMATIAVDLGQARHAARLFGAEEALREAIGAPLPPADQAEYRRYVSEARAMLDDCDFDAAWAEGRAMTLEQAVAFAISSKFQVQSSKLAESNFEL